MNISIIHAFSSLTLKRRMELTALLEISGVRVRVALETMDRDSSCSKTSAGNVKGAALGKGGTVSIIPAIMRESDGKFWSDILRTQRKIPHLLQTEGTQQVHFTNPRRHNAHVTIPSETCFPDFSISTTLSGRWWRSLEPKRYHFFTASHYFFTALHFLLLDGLPILPG